MSKEKVKKKDKWEAYDINKQIISITRQKKRNHYFSFTNKSSNVQCNLTKFSTRVVNKYYHRCYLFNFWK